MPTAGGPWIPCAGNLTIGPSAGEARLLAALEATASRRIVGATLELRNGRSTVRVRFESPYLRRCHRCGEQVREQAESRHQLVNFAARHPPT